MIVPRIELAVSEPFADTDAGVEGAIATRLDQGLTNQGFSDEEQRKALVADITDVDLYGVMPR